METKEARAKLRKIRANIVEQLESLNAMRDDPIFDKLYLKDKDYIETAPELFYFYDMKLTWIAKRLSCMAKALPRPVKAKKQAPITPKKRGRPRKNG